MFNAHLGLRANSEIIGCVTQQECSLISGRAGFYEYAHMCVLRFRGPVCLCCLCGESMFPCGQQPLQLPLSSLAAFHEGLPIPVCCHHPPHPCWNNCVSRCFNYRIPRLPGKHRLIHLSLHYHYILPCEHRPTTQPSFCTLSFYISDIHISIYLSISLFIHLYDSFLHPFNNLFISASPFHVSIQVSIMNPTIHPSV